LISGTRPVFWAYVAFSTLALLAVAGTTLVIDDVLAGTALMWVLFLLFKMGTLVSPKALLCRSARGHARSVAQASGRSTERQEPVQLDQFAAEQPWIARSSGPVLMILGASTLVCAVIIARVFAGVGPSEVLASLSGGSGRYLEYIQFDEIVRESGFAQWPYLILMMYKKALLIYGVMAIVVLTRKPRARHWVFIGMCAAAQIYGSLARGTTFEVFELAVLLMFAFFMRAGAFGKSGLSPKRILLIATLALGAIWYFTYNIQERGREFGHRAASDIQIDDSGALPSVVTTFTSGMFDYWGFGIYYSSTFVDQLWLSSGASLDAGLFPGGLSRFYMDDPSSLMDAIVSMGARWRPDMILLLQTAGFIGLVMGCLLLGSLYRRASPKRTAVALMVQYFVIMQMLSFPVGNFVFVSADNRYLSLLLLFAFLFVRPSRKNLRPTQPQKSRAEALA